MEYVYSFILHMSSQISKVLIRLNLSPNSRNILLPRTIPAAWVAWLTVSLILIGFSTYLTVGNPRPYFIQDYDVENDFFYSSRLITEGQAPIRVSHPGTPIQYIGAGLMFIVGTEKSNTQSVLNLSYFLILLSLVASLAIFTRMVLQRASYSLALAVITSIVIWPPFLTFMNYWSGEIFVIVFGLPTAGLLWRSIEDRAGLSRNRAILLGVGIGLTVSMKAAFISGALLLMATAAIVIIFDMLRDSEVKEIRSFLSQIVGVIPRILLVPTAAVIAFLIATAPVFGRMSWFFVETFRRIFGGGSDSPWSMMEFIDNMIDFAPVFSTFVLTILAIFIVLVFFVWLRWRNGKLDINSLVSSEFNHVAAVFLLAFAFISVVIIGSGDDLTTQNGNLTDAGVILRQLTPFSLMLPFSVLYARRLIRGIGPQRLVRDINKAAGVLIPVAAFGAIVVGLVGYAEWRSEKIRDDSNRLEILTAMLEENVEPGTRIGMIEPKKGGEPMFHLTSDFLYSRDYFEEELLRDYPKYAFIRPAQLNAYARSGGTVRVTESRGELVRYSGVLRIVERALEQWRKLGTDPRKSINVISGGSSAPPVSVVAYRDRMFIPDAVGETEAELDLILQQLIGPIKNKTEIMVGDEGWNILSFTTER